MGEAALEGRPGVIDVEKGWQGRSEINRVIFDNEKVDIDQLEDWIKASGTYLSTVSEGQDSRSK